MFARSVFSGVGGEGGELGMGVGRTPRERVFERVFVNSLIVMRI